MKEVIGAVSLGIAIMVGGILATGGTAMAAGGTGAALFKQHCAVCHPNGSNIMNAKKTLHKSDRLANGVKTEKDILKLVRNPGPGMTKFDKKTLPDSDARKIAKYIIKTF